MGKTIKHNKAKIVDVKVSFAFAHPDPTKRFTWKSARAISLKKAVEDLFTNQYNYWNEGEKEALIQQILDANADVTAIMNACVGMKVKKGVAKQ